MTLSQVQPNIAILVANGFEENHITAVQRQLTQAKMTFRMIAPEQGLVNGWQDKSWGHYFTVDEQISTSMGSDYEMLVIVGGERAVAKLKENPHARRIINHFMEAGKPVAAIGSGVGLLALSPKSAGLTVSASDDVQPDLLAAKVAVSAESQMLDGSVLSADGTDVDAWIGGLMTLVGTIEMEVEAEESESVAA